MTRFLMFISWPITFWFGPCWLYYFVVDDIDAAAARLKAAGGKVLNGPMSAPGGAWIVQAQDPQGVFFALTGPRKG